MGPRSAARARSVGHALPASAAERQGRWCHADGGKAKSSYSLSVSGQSIGPFSSSASLGPRAAARARSVGHALRASAAERQGALVPRGRREGEAVVLAVRVWPVHRAALDL
ncbi:unnamed protein product [Prorocentrum cordatum]|uniref:Uncharacterized protein n=1 Tax=Prorocentrum cordatum TaxID=2364126 RepID=A0ABN9UM43_9DINO|nr:unnamed protein product [Polarella glacialis]